MLNADQYDAIINGIFKHMSIDKYGETTICNIYFDSSDNKLINLSIDKPI